MYNNFFREKKNWLESFPCVVKKIVFVPIIISTQNEFVFYKKELFNSKCIFHIYSVEYLAVSKILEKKN